MSVALRCLVLTVTGLVLLPAVASAVVVERDTATGLLTIVDDAGGADDILVERTSTFDIVSRTGGGLSTTSAECALVSGTIQCVRGTSLAVDLGGGDDRFRSPSVDAPTSVAGGDGQRRPADGELA